MKNKIKYTHIFYLIIIFFVSSCFNKTKVYISPAGSEFKARPIKKSINIQAERSVDLDIALRIWNEPFDKPFVKYNEGEFKVYIQFVEDLPFYKSPDISGVAYRSKDDCHIYMRDHRNYAVYSVLAHEIGHCIGLNHSSYDKSIMYWKPSQDSGITTEIISIINRN